MLNKNDFNRKVDGYKNIVFAIEKAQLEAIYKGEYKFKIFFSKEDKEVILDIAFSLGFEVSMCGCNEMVEYTFC